MLRVKNIFAFDLSSILKWRFFLYNVENIFFYILIKNVLKFVPEYT